ncbi:Protein phosphatase 4 regulatory subunit 1 [Caligus rogercresseyi]|uniref:Protein phosphatase 4 regulatory subunit 1 n=1 Tax=Caligus rogercresseyi TaxID=217165 RepID=A0A7T8KLU1_CALRO|nr:Protein phosphatase 4 regulatory subunit 1 [Caligus rogercresseyi]
MFILIYPTIEVHPKLFFFTQLPKFIKLCHDQMWKIRKSCADEFTPVSCLVSSGVRRRLLSPLFLGLLRDGSQWVREAAFQSLGPFISTLWTPPSRHSYKTSPGKWSSRTWK